MKCIKSKDGEIRRVSDVDAEERVKGGYWKFIPKSEWKLATRKPKNDQATDQAIDQVERPKSKKQLRKQKAEA